MGLRDKVALVLVTAVITQITKAHCMPSSSRKACFKRYLDSFKQEKSNPVPRPSCPKEVIKSIKPIFSKCKNAKVCQKTVPEQSIYKEFYFPETEFPLETSPRDRFYLASDFKPSEISNKQLANQQPETFNNLRKEMRMKRKLNKLTHNENYPTKTEMPSYAEFSSFPEFVWSNGQETFPEVTYPTNAMETWIPHYWNPSVYNPYATDNSEFSTCGPKLSENTTIFFKPYKQQLKSKTKQYIEQMEKYKENMRRLSGSKSKVDNKALDTITSGGLIESDLNGSKKPPADTQPAVNNLTPTTPLNTDEGKCLVNTNSSNNSESVDTRTKTDTNTITSTTDGMDPITTQIESPLVSPVPIPKESVDELSIQPALEPQPIVNESISPKNDNAPENTQTQINEPLPEPSSNDTSQPDNVTDNIDNGMKSDSDTTLPVQENSEESSNSSESLNVISSNSPDSATASTSDSKPIEGKEERPVTSPYTSVFVVPVSNSISKIELPTIESNTGTPIILILSNPPNNEKSTLSSHNTYQSDTSRSLAYNNAADPQESKNFVCDVCSNIQPTPLKYIFEIPSTDVSKKDLVEPAFEMLPNNSMCYDSTHACNNITAALKDVNSSTEKIVVFEPNNVQTETSPADQSKNYVPMDMTQPVTFVPKKSSEIMDFTKDNSSVPMDFNTPETKPNIKTTKDNTSTLKDSNAQEATTPDNSTEYGPNPKQTELMPSDNNKGDTYPSKDKIPPELLNTDNSINNQHAVTSSFDNASDRTSVPEETNPSQPDKFTDYESTNGQSEDEPNDSDNMDGTDGTYAPEEPNSSQPDKFTESGSNSGQGEAGPYNTGNTAIPDDTNPLKTAQSNNSSKPATNNEQAESSPSDNSRVGTSVPEEPNSSQSDKSTDSGLRNGHNKAVPNDTDSRAASEDSNPFETCHSDCSGTNNGLAETQPPDNTRDVTSVPEVTGPPQLDKSTEPESNKGQGEDGHNDTDNKAVPEDTNPLETSQSNNSTNPGTNNEEAESSPSDNSRDVTSVPEEPNSSQSDKSTDSGLSNGQNEDIPNDTDDTATPEDSNSFETSQSDSSGTNHELAETQPSDNTRDVTSVPEATGPPQPDKSTEPESNNGQGEAGHNDTDNLAAPEDTNPLETSQSNNSTNPATNNEQTESSPSDNSRDSTSVSEKPNSTDSGLKNGQNEVVPNDIDSTTGAEDLNPFEAAQSDCSGTNKEQAETQPSDCTRDVTSVPKAIDLPQPDKSTESESNKGQDEAGHNDTDNKAVLKDTNPLETSQSNNSTSTTSNDEQPEVSYSDTTTHGTFVPEEPNTSQPATSTDSGSNTSQDETGTTDTDNKAVPKNTKSPETSPSENSDQTETTPINTLENDSSSLKDMDLTETSLHDETSDLASNDGLNGIAPTDLKKDTALNKKEELTEPIKSVDPDFINDGKQLPADMGPPLSALNNNNLDSEVDKGLSNDVVPDTVKDKELPINGLLDNPNDVELNKGLSDIEPTNIDKTLPLDMGPLNLVTDSSKISGLDKRLADPTLAKILENDGKIISSETVRTNNNKNSKLDKDIVSIATEKGAHDHDYIKNPRLSFIKNIVANIFPDDSNNTEMDRGQTKQLKSKLVYTYRTQAENYERQSSPDVTVSDNHTTITDNPLRVDIKLPLNSLNNEVLPDITLNKNSNEEIIVSQAPLTDNIKGKKITLDESKDSTSSQIGKMFKEAHNKYDSVRNQAMEENPASYNAIHDTVVPVKEDAAKPKELKSAELKDLIKYLYVAVFKH